MISLRDYAKQKGVSYEAVRKQVARYKDELDGHITKVNRTQFLDDEAVAFLDEKRAGNPVTIVQENKDTALEALRTENKALLLQITALQAELIASKDEVKQLQSDKIALLEAAQERKIHWWQRKKK